MKTIILLTLLLLGNSACAKSDRSIFTKLKDSTFKITFEDLSSCTGFNAKVKGKVRTVTAGHCCDKVDTQKLLKFSLSPDVCIFKEKLFNSKQFLKLTKRQPKFADKIYTLGYPKGFGPLMHMGYIMDISKFRTEAMIQLIPGQSGSAVVDSSGNLIGIMSMYNTQVRNHSILTPFKLMNEYLK